MPAAETPGLPREVARLNFARPWRFSPTDKRMCVCGHTAAQHGADPGTTHACRMAHTNCDCRRFRLAQPQPTETT